MAGPILLVHDDVNTIAAIKRMLAREGYELVIATSAADAIIAFGHHLPQLILLAPSVESDRGHVVLEELKQHPDGKLAKVMLLGESIPGFGFPVAPMPPDEDFARQIEELLTRPDETWEVREHERSVKPPSQQLEDDTVEMIGTAPEPLPVQAEDSAGWRASPPPKVEAKEPEAVVPEPDPTAPTPTPRDLEGALFGDLPSLEDQMHKQIEAEAMASVESTLQAMPVDPELEELESEVRAEAARRRKQRELRTPPPPPAVSPPKVSPAQDELQEPPTPPPPRSAAERVSSADLDALEKKREDALRRASELEVKVAELTQKADEAREAWTTKDAAARAAMQSAERALESSRREAADKEKSASSESERLQREAAHAGDLARAEREQRAELERKLDAQAEQTQAQVSEAGEALKAAEAHAEEVKAELALLSEEHAALTLERDKLKADLHQRSETAAELELELEEQKSQLEKQTAELTKRSESAAQLEMKLLEQDEAGANAQKELEHEKGSRATAEAHQAELLHDVAKLEEKLAAAQDELKTRRAQLEEQLELTRKQLEAERESASVALAQRKVEADSEHVRAEKAEQRAKELEDRLVLPLSTPGKPALGVPRTGGVALAELARLIAQLTLAQAEVRLELGVNGGTRNVWLKRGQLVAAESTLPYETLSDRARRDGLIDARQEAELRGVRGASATELLEVMRARNLVRDSEVPGLVQRYTESVALDAFTEPQCTYRLHQEAPGAEVLSAASTRAVLPMVAEALRRALPAESQLEALGGSEAVPLVADTDLDARSLGFADRERRMLSFVDGEATVEDIVLAAGLKAERAYKVLAVAKALGMLEVRAPKEQRASPSPELDVQRLDAKYEQVQEADYFTILGVPRNAGTEEVQRAFDRLSEEFDPIRFSGHPDASLQQRAAVVHRLLEEAARALEDDRRRAEYARHLLD